MNNKLKPALIGGVVLGILSVIPFVSTCCCLWAILGGMLASFLYVKNSPVPATPGDGAMVGAIAGVVGAIIVLFIGIPVSYASGPIMRDMMLGLLENMDPRQAEMMRPQLEASATAIGPLIFQGFILAVLVLVFSIIGGLIGVPIFEKRKGGAPPPPVPPNAGGGPGAYA